MTDTMGGAIVGSAGTVVGVVLGYLLSRAQARGTRKSEAHSLLVAVRWELTDARVRVAHEHYLFPVALPTLDVVVERAFLGDLPRPLQEQLLHTRSVAAAISQGVDLVAEAIKRGATQNEEGRAAIAHHSEVLRGFLPQLDGCIVCLDDHLDRFGTGRLRRFWNRLGGGPSNVATPRSNKGGETADKPGPSAKAPTATPNL
jgi:hypothetical protein